MSLHEKTLGLRSDSSSEEPSVLTEVIHASPVEEANGTDAEKVDIEAAIEGNQMNPDLDEPVFLSGFKLYMITFALALSVLLVALDNAIIATAIPTITTEFDSLHDISWYGSAFLICVCALQPISGKIFQNFSLKWTYLTYIAIFEIGSLLCGAANSSKMLIVGRAVAGCGAAGLFSGALIIVANTISLRERPLYTALIASMFSIASIFGPVLGGAFTEHATWRWCFYINLPIGAVTIAILVLIFHPPERKALNKTLAEKISHLDLPGLGLFIPAVIMLLLAVQWGGTEFPWSSATTIGLLCGSGVMIIIFGILQWHKGDEASIPFRIALQRTVISASLMSFLALGALQVALYYLPVWFQVIKGVSPTESGVMFLGTVLASLVTSLLSGGLVTKLGYYNPWLFFGTASSAIGSALFSTLQVDSGSPKWIGYQVLVGAGSGCIIQMPLIAIMAVVAHGDIPIATSIVVFFQFLGGAIFLAISQSIFNASLSDQLITNLPNVNPQLIIGVGAAGVRKVVAGADLDAVLLSYNGAITTTFYLAIAGASASFFMSFGMEWKSVKGKQLI